MPGQFSIGTSLSRWSILNRRQQNKVLNLAKGIDKGTISASADVEGIWNDQLQNEFIICMKDNGNFPNKKGDLYMLRIPNNLTSQETGERVEFKHRTISELKPKEEQHWWSWSLHQDRSDVKIYDLSVVVDDYRCIEPRANWNNIRTLKWPSQITSDEALLYRGETIKQMVATPEPFLIFSPRRRDLSSFETLCDYSSKIKPCLLLVSKMHIQDKENSQIYYDEIMSVEQLLWASEPKPLWYLALPFAVAADIAIIAIILFILGAMGGGGGTGTG